MSDSTDIIVSQLMEKSDMWDFEDPEDQKEALKMVLDAEVEIQRLQVKKKEAEFTPQTSELDRAKIHSQANLRIAEIRTECDLKIARVRADCDLRITKIQAPAPYRWRTHLVWAVTIVAITAMVLFNHVAQTHNP